MNGAVHGVATTVASMPVAKAPASPAPPAKPAADAGEADAEIGDPREAQPHRQQQIGEQSDDDRRLQLKAPADRGAAGAQPSAARRRAAQS